MKKIRKEQYEYNYRDGVLTRVVDEYGNPKQNDFININETKEPNN